MAHHQDIRFEKSLRSQTGGLNQATLLCGADEDGLVAIAMGPPVPDAAPVHPQDAVAARFAGLALRVTLL